MTIDPEPVLSTSLDATVCSDEVTGIILAVESGSVAADSFEIVSITNGGLTASAGSPTAPLTTTDANEISDDAWMNTGGSAVVVTYRIAPWTAGCRGDEVDVEVTVTPEPVLSASLDATVCSDDVIGVVLAVSGGSVAADSFEIVSITNGGLTASAGSPTAPLTTTNANEISDDAWTNTRDSAVVVTYTVAPWTGGCRGDEVDVEVTIDPTPVVEAGTETSVCSSEAVDLTSLGASITGGASDGTWSSSGTGVFDDTTFSLGTTYTPSEADKDAKTITLTLTSDDPGTTCGPVIDTVVIEILDIRCSQFPWNGN